MNVSFGVELVKRNILSHGTDFTFVRKALNEFNEPTENQTEITVHGLFHQTRGFITKTTTDGTVSRTKPQPQVLTLVDDTSKSIQKDDIMLYCNHKYLVVGINDINSLGIALEISLEMVDDGS